ncbi:hypothetical protein HPB49_003761 [Dermacentor silvarum]|uniref:Uncharacterized protein n=1 Tax=Dermacentor silvarum TaxID=543639 RepID=A0ACB8DU34_DERSI|nr:hypothetical protein HPB49_003761 [Dermacentor silvarum]
MIPCSSILATHLQTSPHLPASPRMSESRQRASRTLPRTASGVSLSSFRRFLPTPPRYGSPKPDRLRYVVAHLHARYANEVWDIIANQPTANLYKRLKTELIRRLSLAEHQKVRLLQSTELAERKPSELLRHMRSLEGNMKVQDFLLRSLQLERLQPHVQAILHAQITLPLDQLSRIADRVIEASLPQLSPTLQAVTAPLNTTELARPLTVTPPRRSSLVTTTGATTIDASGTDHDNVEYPATLDIRETPTAARIHGFELPTWRPSNLRTISSWSRARLPLDERARFSRLPLHSPEKLNCGPVVEIWGDDMAHVVWDLVHERLIEPYVDADLTVFDLSMKHRHQINGTVTLDAPQALKIRDVGVKCATITAEKVVLEKYYLKRMWMSPNTAIRNALGGAVFPELIVCRNIPPRVKQWCRPIIIARHAFRDQYNGKDFVVPRPGTLQIKYSPTIGARYNLEGLRCGWKISSPQVTRIRHHPID